MSTLNLHLFGGLTITQNGQPIPKLISRKADVLLAYLAQEPRCHSRESLATLLWDDRSQKQALSNLRTLLSNLRKKAPAFVSITRKELTIESQVWADTAVFQQQLAAASEQWPSMAAVEQMEQALTLYVGDFLDGVFVSDSFELEDWIQFTREQLRQQMLTARQKLITYYLQQGDYSAGIRHAMVFLDFDPWNEAIHRQLMQLYARNGQRQAALTQYETCVQLLDKELGVAPESQTTELYERIQTAVSAPASNLPTIATTFVGRERELSFCVEQLRNPNCRLLTVVGLGGMGKTRLALQVAAALQTEFLNGVFFVSLASVTSAEGIATAVIEALPTAFQDKASIETQLLNYLRSKEMLLVLDNFEQLLDGTSLLTTILRQAPEITLLVTSRIRLALQTEWLLELDGLSYSDEVMAVTKPEQYAAIHLFEQRARVIAPDFKLTEENLPSVNRICQIVHGLPLGIELAAAWIRVLPIAHLVQQIEKNLDLLATTMRDVPERQRSLTAVFDYVWSLLNEEEQRIFAQLSVFRGSFDVAAFKAISAGSPWTLATLVERSLLHKEATGLYSLIEALRLYATTKLAVFPTVQKQTQAQHSHYYANLLHQQEEHLNSNSAQNALNLIQNDLENIHAAWTHAVETSCWSDLDLAQESLVLYYTYRGPYQEGVSLLETAVSQLVPRLQNNTNTDESRVLAQLHNNYARLAEVAGEYATAIQQAQTAVSLAQGLEQKELAASAHLVWGVALLYQAEYTDAVEHLNIAHTLAEEQDSQQVKASTLNRLGQVSYYQSKYKEARHYQEQSLTLHQKINNQQGVSANFINLGRIVAVEGNYADAKHYYKQALPIQKERGHQRGVGHILTNLGLVADTQSKYEDARRYFEQALLIQEEVGDRQGIANSLNNLGLAATHQGDYANADHYFQRALLIFEELGSRHGTAMVLSNLGIVAKARAAEIEAQHYYERALSIQQEIGDQRGAALSLLNIGKLAESQGQLLVMQQYSYQALAIFEEIGDRRNMMLCHNNLGFVAYNQGMYTDAISYYEQVLAEAEAINDQLLVTYSLLNLANVSYCQEAYAQAHLYNKISLANAKEIGNQHLIGYALTNLAMVLREMEQLDEALSTAKKAVNLRQTLGEQKLGMESRAVLAEVYLAQNEITAAQEEVEPIVAYLNQGGDFEGTEYRLRNRFVCYQVLNTLGDSQGKSILHTTYKRLQKQAEQISDEERRFAFLHKVPWHQAIMDAYE